MRKLKFLSLEELVSQKIKTSKSDPGFIYAVRNEYMPGLIKIGLTRVGVSQRVHSLSTTYPRPWTILTSIKVNHVAAVEKALHEFFWCHRVDQGREFFNVDEDQIENTYQICASIDGLTDKPFAPDHVLIPGNSMGYPADTDYLKD